MKPKSSGPKWLDLFPKTICFQPPTGTLQTEQVIFQNGSSHPIAFKLGTNKIKFYGVKPSKGVIHPGLKETIKFSMNSSMTPAAFKNDNKNHEIYMQALKWPKSIEDYDQKEWKKLETASKDNIQVHTFDITHTTCTTSSKKMESKNIAKEEPVPVREIKFIAANPSKLNIKPPSDAHLVLSNIWSKPIGFKVHTHQGKYYVIHPNKGVILPTQTMKLQVTVDKKTTVAELKTNLEAQKIVVLALEWPASRQTFDPSEWSKLQSNTKDVQQIIVDTIVDSSSSVAASSRDWISLGEQLHVGAVPTSLIFNGIPRQTLPVRIMNMGSVPIAFKVEAGALVMWNNYNVHPKFGVIKSTSMNMVQFSPFDTIVPASLPNTQDKHMFKLKVISWPSQLTEFKEDIWKQYFVKNGKAKVIPIKVSYPGVVMIKAKGNEPGGEYELKPPPTAQFLDTIAPRPAMFHYPIAPQPAMFHDPIAPQPAMFHDPIAPQPAMFHDPIAPQPAKFHDPIAPKAAQFHDPFNVDGSASSASGIAGSVTEQKLPMKATSNLKPKKELEPESAYGPTIIMDNNKKNEGKLQTKETPTSSTQSAKPLKSDTPSNSTREDLDDSKKEPMSAYGPSLTTVPQSVPLSSRESMPQSAYGTSLALSIPGVVSDSSNETTPQSAYGTSLILTPQTVASSHGESTPQSAYGTTMSLTSPSLEPTVYSSYEAHGSKAHGSANIVKSPRLEPTVYSSYEAHGHGSKAPGSANTIKSPRLEPTVYSSYEAHGHGSKAPGSANTIKSPRLEPTTYSSYEAHGQGSKAHGSANTVKSTKLEPTVYSSYEAHGHAPRAHTSAGTVKSPSFEATVYSTYETHAPKAPGFTKTLTLPRLESTTYEESPLPKVPPAHPDSSKKNGALNEAEPKMICNKLVSCADSVETRLLFTLNPAELNFKPPYGQHQSCILKICNRSEGVLAFKVQSNKKQLYRVSPTRGLLLKGKELDLKFELLESFTGKDIKESDVHRFQVMGYPWPKDLNVTDIDPKVWQKLEDTKIDQKQTVCFDASFL